MEIRLVVKNPLGLHLRPATDLCNLANQFDSQITLHFREREFDAKSLLSVLSACVQCEDEIVLDVAGADEAEAAEKIRSFMEGLTEEST